MKKRDDNRRFTLTSRGQQGLKDYLRQIGDTNWVGLKSMQVQRKRFGSMRSHGQSRKTQAETNFNEIEHSEDRFGHRMLSDETLLNNINQKPSTSW